MDYNTLINHSSFERVKDVMDVIIGMNSDPCTANNRKDILQYMERKMPKYEFDWNKSCLSDVLWSDIGITVSTPYDRENVESLMPLTEYINCEFNEHINGQQIYSYAFPCDSSAMFMIIIVDNHEDIDEVWQNVIGDYE